MEPRWAIPELTAAIVAMRSDLDSRQVEGALVRMRQEQAHLGYALALVRNVVMDPGATVHDLRKPATNMVLSAEPELRTVRPARPEVGAAVAAEAHRLAAQVRERQAEEAAKARAAAEQARQESGAA